MSSLLEQIARQAKETFSKDSTDPDFKDNFNKLVMSVDTVKPSDVRVNESVQTALGHTKRIFPCFNIEVFLTETFLIGIYILKPGVKVPLHDHPGIHGILKVIQGPVRISAYTSLVDEPGGKAVPQDIKDKVRRSHGYNPVFIPVNKHEPMLVSSKDQPCIVRPKEGNFHEICAVDHMAVFLEVIAPPFDRVERVCTFYEAFETAEEEAAIKTWLVETPPDVKFFCTDLPYCGPEIKL